MEISEDRQGDVIVLNPTGRINNDTSPVFQTRLVGCVGSAAANVLVDLSRVEYISSAGLRALMIASRQSKATGGRLAVAALTPVVNEIFTISHFGLVVQVFATRAEAIAALTQPSSQ
jgi:anti-anti-sigma factor